MPRGTTRDPRTGIPISWIKHYGVRILASAYLKGQQLSPMRAAVLGKEKLEDDWAKTLEPAEEEVLTGGDDAGA